MNVSKNSLNFFSVFRQRFGAGSMMKSTQEKLERQQKAQSKIEYWESQKENLKQMECDTVEEIGRKLELFHSYEDEINAAKKAYNFEQMHHILDEAEEQGKKIAEAVEKTEPKTEEERKKEAIEDATGTEDTEGVLDELLEELPEELEDLKEELENLSEELAEEAEKSLSENAVEEAEKSLSEKAVEEAEKSLSEKAVEEAEKSLSEKAVEEAEKSLSERLSEKENLAGKSEETQAEKLARESAENRARELARKRYMDLLNQAEEDKGAQLDYRM